MRICCRRGRCMPTVAGRSSPPVRRSRWACRTVPSGAVIPTDPNANPEASTSSQTPSSRSTRRAFPWRVIPEPAWRSSRPSPRRGPRRRRRGAAGSLPVPRPCAGAARRPDQHRRRLPRGGLRGRRRLAPVHRGAAALALPRGQDLLRRVLPVPLPRRRGRRAARDPRGGARRADLPAGRAAAGGRRDPSVEPGRALLDQAGCTVFRVQGVEERDGYAILTVDGSSLSLSEQWFESEFLTRCCCPGHPRRRGRTRPVSAPLPAWSPTC
ncbi:hypothetical protein SGRIM128S_07488 [Streptomyces griseomycini]